MAAGYLAVLAIAAALVFARHMQYVNHPQDAAAAGGMWAGGDLALEIIIGFLFLLPTIALVLVIAKFEAANTTYAKVLLGLSLTGPLSLGLLAVPVLNQWYWGDAIVFRLFAIPLVIVVLVFSRWLARFARARRLISYALLIEALTFVLTIAGLFVFARLNRH